MSKKPTAGSETLPPVNRLDRRIVVFGVGALAWLTLSVVYTGTMWPIALYRLVVEGLCLLPWIVAALGYGSTMLRLFRVSGDEVNSPLLMVTSAALGLGAMSLLVLGLGLAGILSQIVAIALVAIGVILAGAWLLRSKLEFTDVRAALAQRACWNWLWLLSVPFAAITTVGAMYPPLLLWTPDEPHGYDVVEYHLQIPREWFEAHRIVPLTHNAFSFFPFNVEMHYLLAMHLRGGPWAGMYLAQFMHASFMALLVLSAWAGASAIFPKKPGVVRGPGAGIIAGLAVVAAPVISQLGAIAYDEGGFLLFGILSLIWAILAIRDEANRSRRFILAGVFAGLACGSKLTALPEVLTAIGAIAGTMLLVQKSLGIVRRLMPVFAFGLAGLLVFSPWLIRTQVWAGNPVFPELPALGHGYFSNAQVERWHHAHTPRPEQRGIVPRLKAGATEVLTNWQFGFLLIPAAVVCIAISRSNQQVRILGAMLFLLAVFWLGFTHLQGRFFALGIPICALLIASAPRIGFVAVILTLVVSAVTLNREFVTPDRRLEIAYLGTDNLSDLTPLALQSIPPDAKIALVGDAKAFLYQIPMSRLTYRTIFDVNPDASPNFIDLFAGPKPAGVMQCLLIDPDELQRFARTYQPFPPIPTAIAGHTEPYAVER